MGFGFYKRGLVYEVRGDFGVASCYILFNIKNVTLASGFWWRTAIMNGMCKGKGWRGGPPKSSIEALCQGIHCIPIISYTTTS